MASTPQARLQRDVLNGSEGRHPPLHILFVHSQLAEVERCLKELNKMHFTVSAEIVGTPEEFSKRLGAHAYDLVVAEYPSPDWRGNAGTGPLAPIEEANPAYLRRGHAAT